MNLYQKLSTHPFIFRRITGLTLEEFTTITKKLNRIWKKKHLKKKKIEGRPYGPAREFEQKVTV